MAANPKLPNDMIDGGKITELSEKVTPHNNDILTIEDSEDSYNKKKVKMSNVGGGGGGTVTSVDTGTGLTGGPITTTGTISLNASLNDLTDVTIAGTPYTLP